MERTGVTWKQGGAVPGGSPLKCVFGKTSFRSGNVVFFGTVCAGTANKKHSYK